MGEYTRSAVDRLGSRLRRGEAPRLADAAMFADYRAGFAPVLDAFIRSVRSELPLFEAAARLKTLESAVAKLKRMSIGLSRVRDIAGLRIVVDSWLDQEHAVQHVAGRWKVVNIVDHRTEPACGYRAVHLVVVEQARFVEVQVRTRTQHIWGNLSEAAARHFGVEVKYCGGPAGVRQLLDRLSVAGLEIDLSGRDFYRDLAQLAAKQDPQAQESLFAEVQRSSRKLALAEDAFAEHRRALLAMMDQ